MLRNAVRAALVLAIFAVFGRVGAESERTDARAAPVQNAAELAIVRFGGRSAILLLDIGTGRARELQSSVRGEGSPSWSPDGAALAFVGVSGGERGRKLTDIFVVSADGSGLRRLTQSGRASGPLWSPDGSTIVFSQRAAGNRFPTPLTLWAIGANGGDQRELTRADGVTADLAGSFAPDGRRLLFTRVSYASQGQQFPGSIYSLDLGTGGVERVVERAGLPAYSPDGTRVAYMTDVDENGSLSYGDRTKFATELYVMDGDGGARRRLTRTRDLDESSPAWSPDGNVIAYVRGKQFDNAEGFAVLGMAPDGTCARFLAADPSFGARYGSPAWRPATAAAERCPPARPGAGVLRNDLRAELQRARAFRGFGVFWAGDRIDDLLLGDVHRYPSRGPGGKATVHSFIYRNCRIAREGSGCAQVQIQLWPACASVPADIDAPSAGRVQLRGVEGVFFAGGSSLSIVTGTTTIEILAAGRPAALRVARSLRGLNVRVGVRDKLPRPAPGVLRRENRCR